MIMARQYWKPSNMLYPVPAVLVSCVDENGRANVMTAAWAGTICSDPVMLSVSIRKERYSHAIIKRTGEFVVSLTTEKLAKVTDYVGVRSGKDIDKFALTGDLNHHYGRNYLWQKKQSRNAPIRQTMCLCSWRSTRPERGSIRDMADPSEV